MERETCIALDLEGTLISNAVSQFSRPGLYDFLEFCRASFEVVCLYTAVRDEVCERVLETLVEDGFAPEWVQTIPLVQWDRTKKDLTNIPGVEPANCVIVDDNRDYIVDEQIAQWIPIAKYESPYSPNDRELPRVQQVIEDRVNR